MNSPLDLESPPWYWRRARPSTWGSQMPWGKTMVIGPGGGNFTKFVDFSGMIDDK
jgi:hypothetical protein